MGEATEKGGLLGGLLSRIRPSGMPAAGLFAAAEELRVQGELEAAAKLCAEGLRQLPDSATGHVVLGEVLQDQGQPEQAEREWLEALRLHPGHPRAHLRLAQLYLGRGETTRALVEVELSLRANPDSPEARALLSSAKTQAGQDPRYGASQLLATLRRQTAVAAAGVIDKAGQLLDGDAGLEGETAELAAQLMLGTQPLVERLGAGSLLSASIVGKSGEVVCAALGDYAVVAALKRESETCDLVRAVIARGVARNGAGVE